VLLALAGLAIAFWSGMLDRRARLRPA